MLDKEFHTSALIAAHLKNELTANRRAELEQWLAEDPGNMIFFNQLQNEERFKKDLDQFLSADKDRIWQRTINELGDVNLSSNLTERPKVRKLWPIITGIAVALAFFIAGLNFFKLQTQPRVELHDAKDVKPGSYGATLTLSNGKKIKLTEALKGKLAEEAGVIVTKTAGGQIAYQMKGSTTDPDQINTLSTDKGETYIVTLPDQSKVWLNAGSSLTYAASLSVHKKRIVRLTGEAYFEVSKDKKHPFVVKTALQNVEVLGTHFNINAYQDEPYTRTTLLEGSVVINSDQLLKPGEVAINNSAEIRVQQADIQLETAWKNDDFYLKQEPMESVMRKITRWYGITVDYTDERLKKVPISGIISRTKPLSIVLDRLGAAGHMRFKITDKKITVLQEDN